MSDSNPWASASDQPAEDSANTTPWQAKDANNNAADSNPWGQNNAAESTGNDSSNWLNEASQVDTSNQTFSLSDPFAEKLIPFDIWVEDGLEWLVTNFRDFFQAIRLPVDWTLNSLEAFLLSLNPWVVVLFFTLFAWQMGGRKLGAMSAISLIIIGFLGAWSETMVTLALVFTAVLFSLIIGIPLGIWMGKSDRVKTFLMPVLDAMQTTPAFVYLIPIVMLFGIGNVPGVVVTIIFALPPLVRLTSLGIRQVPKDLIEAGQAYGASPMQMLFKIELPVAKPTIMAGINQNLMLSLSMVVIASMIAVGGLGQMVLRGIGRLDMGLAAIGGLAIVLLAIILDRITQSMGQPPKAANIRWYQREPLAWLSQIFTKENKG
ncbi:glycine betaine/L-proline ABC transporter permease ProW [Thiomicrorhabdus sediminis]|uniref:Glycine betaine/L-proline ABC transporter permease ProW n=1 Tax=Thiomicrorhabdus sediminis TaxID=2580412 RepID=A0A4P9K7L5_9GAMM|nr:glycine betaine/L-proline ABC transporter permease ProW [Thiomicrorhabdus sediminis]QCU91049.1 glycine betaine/L-proline ABC transporter permease ProW [Thiomicrorhabdus sediminis]